MSDSKPFVRTPKQIQATKLLAGPAKHVLLRGGSRSGKTVILFRALVLRALKEPKSRHLVLRLHFAHCKQGVWYDTLPYVMESSFPGLRKLCKFDKVDWFVRLPNESEIWFGGLDDKERTDKILGREFSTIFFNECSEMDYASIGIALTRLSQKNDLVKKCYYDCNPPKSGHWTEKLFIQKVDPLQDGNVPLSNPEHYATLQINPRDNEANLDPDYISSVLEKLPPMLRKRFLDGEYGSDDLDIIRSDWIVPSECLEPDKLRVRFTFVDPAYTEEERATANTCESAVVTIGIDPQGIIHDLEVLHGRWSYEELKQVIKAVERRNSLAARHYLIGIEDVAAQKWLKEDLDREGVHCVLIRPDADKIRRTISVTDLLEQGRCRINNPYLSSQLLGFPGNKLKDTVDAYVGCLKMVKAYGGDLHVEKEDVFRPWSYEERVRRWIRKRQERQARMKTVAGKARDPILGSNW